MFTAIMQQLSEMFLVFLEGDLPGMLALFLCGIVGWYVTKHINGRYSSLARIEAKTKSMDSNHCDDVDSSSKSKTRSRKRSKRLPKPDDASPTSGATIEVKPLCSPTTYTTDVADVATDSAAAGEQCESDPAPPRDMDDARLAKIMAKKAERKARKLQEPQALQTEQEKHAQRASHSSNEDHQQAASQAASYLLASYDVLGAPKQNDAFTPQEFSLSDACLCDSSLELVAPTEQECVPLSSPCMPVYTDQAQAESDKACVHEEDVHRDSTADEEEQKSCDAELVRPAGSTTPCGDSGKMTSCGASEATPSEDDGISVCDGYSTSEETWGVGQVGMPPISYAENSSRMCTHFGDEGWMTSFEDAANDEQRPGPPGQESSGFVHFDASTGNEVWFEPVQQNDGGTQFYSDGQQLYQAVCVRVEDLMSSDGTFQANLSPENAFQSQPTDLAGFQTISSDGIFQQHQACDFSFATADGSCWQQLPSDGTENTQGQNHFGDGCLQSPMTGINNGCILNILNPQDYSLSSKVVEEDEAWNMCWDFLSSAWNP